MPVIRENVTLVFTVVWHANPHLASTFDEARSHAENFISLSGLGYPSRVIMEK